jgi:chemotaxis protein histidine kinase CheA
MQLWDEWVAVMVDYSEPEPMTAEEALQQAMRDGLVLRPSATLESESIHHSMFCNVKRYELAGRIHFKAMKWIPGTGEFHIKYAATAEEAALHTARFCACPLGLAVARRRVLEARFERDERSRVERGAFDAAQADARRQAAREKEEERETKKAAEQAARDTARRAAREEAAKRAEEARQAAEGAKRALSKARAGARASAKEAAKAAKDAAKAAAKEATKLEREQVRQWQAQRQAQLAAMQKQQLREAAERQAERRACAAGTTPSGASGMGLEGIEGWPTAALVRHVLGAARHDPWHCLGLDVGSPPEAVRKRYLHLALKLHPDKAWAERDAEEAFTIMEAAFRTVYC